MKPRIVLADANAAQRKRLAKALASEGYGVLEAADGQTALSYLQQDAPALAILDANLPLLGGVELCFRLKRVPHLQEVPVGVLAFASDKEAVRRAGLARADWLLLKPVGVREVLALVREILGTRKGLVESTSRAGPVS